MKTQEIKSTLSIYDSLAELPESIQELFSAATDACHKAYAPYSHYAVGAALRLDDDSIVKGSNQENAAYPSGLCAERTAIFYAGANYPEQKIKSIAITVKSANKVIDSPTSPCGACRQAIAEYEFKQQQPIAIYFKGEIGKIYKVDSLSDLLPLAFNGGFI